jgi:hypothetical protein
MVKVCRFQADSCISNAPNTACSVHPTLRQAQGPLVGLPLRGVRDFKRFLWLEIDSVKMALSRPTHQYPEGA